MDSVSEYIFNALKDLTAVEVIHLKEVDSTNDLALEVAKASDLLMTVVLADSQQQGRGRRGRQWLSPEGNLYLSIAFKPRVHIRLLCLSLITLMAGVAVVEAVDRLYGYRLDLKWPNDIMIENKKLGGVLTESRLSPEKPPIFVIGIGLNITDMDFPEELRGSATTLSSYIRPEMISRDDLAIEIVRAVFRGYKLLINTDTKKIITSWIEKNSTLTKTVRIEQDGSTIEGLAEAIDQSGRLIVKTKEGQRLTVESGSLFYC